MPLAHIDLIKGKPESYRQAIGEAVYQALLSIGVPQDDRFQVITEHEPPELIATSMSSYQSTKVSTAPRLPSTSKTDGETRTFSQG